MHTHTHTNTYIFFYKCNMHDVHVCVNTIQYTQSIFKEKFEGLFLNCQSQINCKIIYQPSQPQNFILF